MRCTSVGLMDEQEEEWMEMDLEGEYQFQCQWGIGVFYFITIGVVGDSLNGLFTV